MRRQAPPSLLWAITGRRSWPRRNQDSFRPTRSHPRQPCVHADSVGLWVCLVSFCSVWEGGSQERGRPRRAGAGRRHGQITQSEEGAVPWAGSRGTRVSARQRLSFPGAGGSRVLSGSARHGGSRNQRALVDENSGVHRLPGGARTPRPVGNHTPASLHPDTGGLIRGSGREAGSLWQAPGCMCVARTLVSQSPEPGRSLSLPVCADLHAESRPY